MINLSYSGKLTINLVILFGVMIGCSLFYFFPYLKGFKKLKFKDFFRTNIDRLIVSSIFLIGILIRTIFLDLLPGGLNQDEASAGYDAFSIMYYGVDRNGFHLPIYLTAWGSGQNALYSYLSMPFIGIFGLNELSLRLPAAIISCISLFAIYNLFNTYTNKTNAIIALAFLAINPWHIIKSRWALESNIFPDLVFISIVLLLIAIKTNKKWMFYVSPVILALSAYAYATSYFFLTVLLITLLAYLIITKKVKWYEGLIYLGIAGILVIPLIIFCYINFFDKDTIVFLGLTIPKLTSNRLASITNLFEGNFFYNIFKHFGNSLLLILVQNDNILSNSVYIFGTMYLITLPFTIFGVVKSIKDKSLMNRVMQIWLISSFALMFIVDPNINRINIAWIPLIYFSIIGIIEITSYNLTLRKTIIGSYMAYFLAFACYYPTKYNDDIKPNFFYSLGESIEFANSLKVDKIYITKYINMPYIFALFYDKENPNTFINTHVYSNPGGAFQQVLSYGKYEFQAPIYFESNTAIILKTSETTNIKKFQTSAQNIKYFTNYVVIY